MSVKTLQAIVGIFFLLLGIMGIMTDIDEGVFGISNRHIGFEVVFGVIELICGIIMIAGLFARLQRRSLYRASMVVFVLWIVRIVFSRIVWGPPQNNLASVLNWFLVISVEAIIAASIWLLATTYQRHKQ
jgi:hypothetical protein